MRLLVEIVFAFAATAAALVYYPHTQPTFCEYVSRGSIEYRMNCGALR